MSRSLKKGVFVAPNLIRKVQFMNYNGEKLSIKTWSRATTIIPNMLGHTISVHNGRQHIPVFVDTAKIGHKLGEFAPSRTFRSHKKTDNKGQKGKKN
jgi:small subunit ribosomal protein S19